MKILTILFAVFALSSCATVNKSEIAANLNPQIESHLKADITVDMNKKLRGTASGTVLFGLIDLSGPDHFADGVIVSPASFFSFGNGPASLKAAAAYNAIRSGNADVLVNPQYVMEHKSYVLFSKTTVTVTGYAGTIKKIE